MATKRVKTTRVISHGSKTYRKGAVVELDAADADGLINVGYAQATTAAVSDDAEFKSVGGNISGVAGKNGVPERNVDGDSADADAALLEGTVPEVVAKLDGLDAAALKRLAKMEAKGKDRKGVLDAIAAAQDAG